MRYGRARLISPPYVMVGVLPAPDTVAVRRICVPFATLVGLIRSGTMDSGGTTSAGSVTKFDSLNTAATATALVYSANPTVGTLAGNLFAVTLGLPAAASVGATPVLVEFGNPATVQKPVLRGTTQQFALNGAGATYPTGHSLNCSVVWTEQ